jgi:hypothetical protein
MHEDLFLFGSFEFWLFESVSDFGFRISDLTMLGRPASVRGHHARDGAGRFCGDQIKPLRFNSASIFGSAPRNLL